MDPKFEEMCELWKQTQREGETQAIAEKNIHNARQYIQNFTNRFNYDSSKMAEIMWRNTLREDWVNIIYQEKFDMLDILDMTLYDVMSLPCFQSQYNYGKGTDNDAYEFFKAIINIRDKITRPIAEIIYIFETQDSPESDWYLAQKILRELFEAKALINSL